MIDAPTLLEEVPCGIFAFTENGTITTANAYCYRLLEYESDELTGLNFASLLTISGRIFFETHLYPLVKMQQHAQEIFLLFQTKNQQDVPVLLNAVISQVNGVSQFLCSFITITNRRKYEDEILLAKRTAEEALYKNEILEKVKHELELHKRELDKQITILRFQNKELLQLSNIITHDLQEPLRKIILFSSELQKEDYNPSSQEYALGVVKKSSQRMKNLLYNLQNYLTLTTETSQKDRVNLEEVVYYELQQLQKSYADIHVQTEIEPLPVIVGYKNQLNWMFHHLIKNAFEHGTTNNKLALKIQSVLVKENVFVSLEHKYKYVDFVKLTITDKGAGFEPKYNQHIFEVLKRLNLKEDTLGFGLAFCKRIVENHFGTIKAEGGVGRGATFTVMLPINNTL
jgi:phosphoserine phosphatase RsbU/P